MGIDLQHSPNYVQALSRRQVLLGGAGAIGLMSFPLAKIMADNLGPLVVDTHHHYFPPKYIAQHRADILATGPGYAQVLDWTPEKSLAAMDKAGVNKAILSITAPGVWFGNARDAARVTARECNEYAASLVRANPNRFGFFASLPLPDQAASIAELQYAFDHLGATGVVLLTSYDGHYLGDALYTSVMAELDKRSALIFVHPRSPQCCLNTTPELPPAFIEFPTDTTRTAASLLFTGTLAKFRNVRFIFSHGGGTLPMLTGRIGMWVQNRPELQKMFPQGLQFELARHYYDTVSISSESAVAALKSFIPTSQLLFGSDFPYSNNGAIAPLLSGLQVFNWSDADQALVKGLNAQRLLKL